MQRQQQKISGARQGDIPQPNALASQLVGLRLLYGGIVRACEIKDREVNGVVLSPVQELILGIQLGHRVYGDDNGPLEALGRMHGDDGDGVDLGVRPALGL